MEYLQGGFHYAAILDLKAAYDRVPRDKLIVLLKRRLPNNLFRQVVPFLLTTWTRAVGDTSPTEAELTRGVPQESPLSPSLFNIFMDVLDERIQPKNNMNNDSRIILFADDVQLRARTREGLQAPLNAAKQWADEFDMTWSASKCATIQPENDTTPFYIGGELISVADSETYLGVTITLGGLSDDQTAQRVQKARARLEMLKRIGMNAKGFGPMLCRKMFLTFVRPMYEYALHLVPLKSQTTTKILQLEKAFFSASTGIHGAPLRWFRKLFQIEDMTYRRARLREQLRLRAAANDRIQLGVLQLVLEEAGNTKSLPPLRETWESMDAEKKRPLPLPSKGLLPMLQLNKHYYRILSMKWFLHRFPASISKVHSVMGGAGQIVLRRLSSILPKSKWTGKEARELKAAIDGILAMIPYDQAGTAVTAAGVTTQVP